VITIFKRHYISKTHFLPTSNPLMLFRFKQRAGLSGEVSGVAARAGCWTHLAWLSEPRLFSQRRHTNYEPPHSFTRWPVTITLPFGFASVFKMAGIVRQPIDIQSLERFISQNVPEIKTPIDIKQVSFPAAPPQSSPPPRPL
jgi:hypothetical protein